MAKKKSSGWLDKYDDGGPVQPNYNDAQASYAPNFVGDGYSNVGRNYSPAWGGQFQMGGSMPGAVGFMYARTIDPAPSKGPYGKKTVASAQNGMEMEYYQNGLDFKPKSISKNGTTIDPSLFIGKNPKTFGKNVAAPMSTSVNKVLPADPTKLTTQAQRDAQEAKERRNRINVANAVQDQEWSSPKNFAVSTSAIADKLRFSDSPNSFDDSWLNPIPMIGHAASALGRVPLNIQEGNYGQAALDVAAPVAFGAAETLVSPYIEKYVTTPATKALGEGINYALRNTTKYNNLNEIGRHVLGGVPPERSLERLTGEELRHARIINELGNKNSMGVPLGERVAYATREGLPQEKLEQLFPHLKNQTPGSATAPPVPPVPASRQSTFGTPNPELARLRNQAITPEIENAAMSMPEDIANRGDMDEMMAWMANNNRSIRGARSMDELAVYDDPFSPEALAQTQREMDALDAATGIDYEVDQLVPSSQDRVELGNFEDEFSDMFRRTQAPPSSAPRPYDSRTPEGREVMREMMRGWRRDMESETANQLPSPPDEITLDADGNAEYTRLSDEARAANEAFAARRLASDNQRLTDAATAFMLEHNANLANPGSLGSARFPRSSGPAGGIDHNSFMDFYNNSGLTLREIAEGAADTGGDYLQSRYRLYAQDILDPSAPSVQDMLNTTSAAPSMPLESINLNPNPSPFDLNIRGNGNLNKGTTNRIGNSRRIGDPIYGRKEDIIPPISEIPQILSNRFANSFQEYPLYQGPVRENIPLLLMGREGKKRVADKIGNAISNASESGQVYTGSTSTSHNSYLTQLKQQFKMSKENPSEYTPQFLGYKYMNDMGNLSDAGYGRKNIAAYLNAEIDQQIKRGIIPKNIQRPYVKKGQVMLPHYGLKKNEYGGTLEYFEQGGQLTKLDQLTNFTNYNTKQPGSWLEKYQ